MLVATVNFSSGTLEYHDLSQYSYEKALESILASCNIPILANGISIKGHYHYDGGVLSSQAGLEYLKSNRKKIKEFTSVWARGPKVQVEKEWSPKGLSKMLSVGSRAFEILIKDHNSSGEWIEDYICKMESIKHKKYFFQTELDSIYDLDMEERVADWENGLRLGKN